MKITILTLFPEFYDAFLVNSIIKRAIKKGIIEFEILNIRDYSADKNHRVDHAPTGGGAGLIMMMQPLTDALKSVRNETSKVILMGPKGTTFTQNDAQRLSKVPHLILVAGHYEGVDNRFNKYIDEELSIGDYVLTGGELPSMVISDAITRLLDGCLATDSTKEESFTDGLLEYNQYTEPTTFDGMKVPDILYSGNHEAIRKFRLREALVLTRLLRPDLFSKRQLTKEEKQLLHDYDAHILPPWEEAALFKGQKFIKKD